MLPPARVWVSLGRASSYMQSHPLYLISPPLPAAPRIALFRVSTGIYALFLRKLGPVPGTRVGTRGDSSRHSALPQKQPMHRARSGSPHGPPWSTGGAWWAEAIANPRRANARSRCPTMQASVPSVGRAGKIEWRSEKCGLNVRFSVVPTAPTRWCARRWSHARSADRSPSLHHPVCPSAGGTAMSVDRANCRRSHPLRA